MSESFSIHPSINPREVLHEVTGRLVDVRLECHRIRALTVEPPAFFGDVGRIRLVGVLAHVVVDHHKCAVHALRPELVVQANDDVLLRRFAHAQREVVWFRRMSEPAARHQQRRLVLLPACEL